MRREQTGRELPGNGLAAWLWSRLRGRGGRAQSGPRLTLLERIPLAPRQSLALVEAEGRRFLVATSAEGSPAFYALENRAARAPRPARCTRVTW